MGRSGARADYILFRRRPQRATAMTLTDAVADYVKRMVSLPSVKGMKSLILDQETSGIVGLAYTQTLALDNSVYIVERIDAKSKEMMSHLKAVVFVRPTMPNIGLLKGLLKNPQYQEFHLFFSNILPREMLRDLAEADAYDLVKEVHEYYADYFAIGSDLFSVNMPLTFSLFGDSWGDAENAKFNRICDSLLSLALSLKTRPVVRYQGSSPLCDRIAKRVEQVMAGQRDLFSFGSDSNVRPLLLVLDRREDPVTPLLMQWTYRSILHEVIGMHNNRLSIRDKEDKQGKVGKKEVVLGDDDAFYKSSALLNFGDLGVAVRAMVQGYQKKTKTDRQLDTIEAMQRFVENYSEYLAESTSVSKHVGLVSELSRIVEERNLMELSAIQQSLSCEHSHTQALRSVLDTIKDPKFHDEDKLRIVCLYALRYEQEQNDTATCLSLLRDRSTDETFRSRVALVSQLLRYAGSSVRTQDLYLNKDIFAKATNLLSSGIKGVENIFTQHDPLLARTADAIRKGRLKTTEFPIAGSNPQLEHSTKQVFIFIVGGATYEEAACIAQINKDNRDCQFLLGGTTFHNSTSFLDDIALGNNTSPFTAVDLT